MGAWGISVLNMLYIAFGYVMNGMSFLDQYKLIVVKCCLCLLGQKGTP